MRGEIIGVWGDTWRDLWVPLSDAQAATGDLFAELYRELANVLRVSPSAEQLAEIVTDRSRSREAFANTRAADLRGERAVVEFLEMAHPALEDLGGDDLGNLYFNLLGNFIERYSLRYDLRRPCTLCPTLPGVFANLMRAIRAAANLDEHLANHMRAFEESIRDLRHGCTDIRIMTCIQKQFNLMEAFGKEHRGVTQRTLGSICEQLDSWPHDKVKEAMRNLYGFASDYPGIRHGGTPANALRAIELRDMVAMSVLLTGFTPYLTDLLDANLIYQGA